jgi:ubiquitin C-terminal hydrolase
MTQKNNTKRKNKQNSKGLKNSKYGNTKKRNNKNKNSKNHFSKNKKHSYVMNGGNICELFSKQSISSTQSTPPPIPPRKLTTTPSPNPSIPSPIPLQRKNSVATISTTIKPLVYTAIANVGNTCYMNATLQMLWSIPEIREYIIQLDKEFIRNKYHLDYIYKISYILNTIFTVFNSKTKEDDNYYGKNEKEKLEKKQKLNEGDIALQSLKMLNLSSIIDKKYIEDYNQRDAQEYLNYLLNFLCDSDDFSKKCNFIDLNQYIKYDEESTTTCLYREKYGEVKTFTKKENAFILQLPLSKIDPKNNNISYLIGQYQEIEQLSKDEYLNRCFETHTKSGEKGPATKEILIKKPSNNLIIQLKRFVKSIDGDGNFLDSNKIRTYINPDPTIQIDRIIFKLQGCIIHTGGTKGGHYVYLVFDDNGKPYKIIDDSRIIKSNNNYLTDGYIYYYRRQIPI